MNRPFALAVFLCLVELLVGRGPDTRAQSDDDRQIEAAYVQQWGENSERHTASGSARSGGKERRRPSEPSSSAERSKIQKDGGRPRSAYGTRRRPTRS